MPTQTPQTSGLWLTGYVLETAIQDEQPVLIIYVAADGEQSDRIIEPYELAATRAGHVIVRTMDRRSGDLRCFRLDRITHLAMLNGAFQLDRDATIGALARVRAQIAGVAPDGYGHDSAAWSPGDPIYP